MVDNRSKILVIAFSDLTSDARVSRQIRWLKEHHDVVVAALRPGDPGVKFIPCGVGRAARGGALLNIKMSAYFCLRRYQRVYWCQPRVRDAYSKLRHESFDLVIANDLNSLPLAIRLAEEKGAKLFFDAHEYSPLQFENRPLWRFIQKPYRLYLLRQSIPSIDCMTTVCGSIARRYEVELGIRVSVVTNAADFHDLQATNPGERIKIVHHGLASRSRRLENLVDIGKKLADDRCLTLILVPRDPGYVEELQARAKGFEHKVRLESPQSQKNLVPYLNRFDISLLYFEPTTFNLRCTLPNKFFESVQARLAVFSGPSEELVPYIQKFDIGVVTEAFSTDQMVKALNEACMESITRWKLNCDALARIEHSDNHQPYFRALIKETLELGREVAVVPEKSRNPQVTRRSRNSSTDAESVS